MLSRRAAIGMAATGLPALLVSSRSAFALDYPTLYGLTTVVLALAAGLIAGRFGANPS